MAAVRQIERLFGQAQKALSRGDYRRAQSLLGQADTLFRGAASGLSKLEKDRLKRRWSMLNKKITGGGSTSLRGGRQATRMAKAEAKAARQASEQQAREKRNTAIKYALVGAAGATLLGKATKGGGASRLIREQDPTLDYSEWRDSVFRGVRRV